MIELSKKLILFTAILILIKLLIVSLYKDEHTNHSENFAEQDFNTVFIGSSRTKFSVIPTYFDSMTKNLTKSYNFGIDAGLPPQTLDWCEEIIKSKTSIKYIYFELSGGLNRFPIKHENWRNFRLKNYLQGIPKQTSKEFVDYHNELIRNFFKPYYPKQHINYNSSTVKMKEYPIRKVTQKELSFAKRRNTLVENSFESNQINEEYWNRISRIIELAEAKNIRVYFFIPPRVENDKELMAISPIYKKLPKKYKIRPAHFDESLYKPETSVDDSHLNYAGAKIFTKMLADEFNKQK